jgi:hypothetical protein
MDDVTFNHLYDRIDKTIVESDTIVLSIYRIFESHVCD